MDVTKLLESQHRDVEDLFERYEAAQGDEAKQRLFDKIADALAAHASVEEKYFYPVVYVGSLKDKLTEAVEEHLAAKRIIADLLGMEAGESNYDSKVKVLKEEIEHHVEEEESELFPQVRKNFSIDELQAMGDQVSDAFEELIDNSPRFQVPNETSEAAPLS